MVGGMLGKSVGKAKRALKKPPAWKARREGREGKRESEDQRGIADPKRKIFIHV